MQRQYRFKQGLGFMLAAALFASVAMASSHSEAPGTSKDRLADDTDLYAWVANDAPDAVTLVGNWVPLIEPNSGPNFVSFDDDVTYYMNIDNVGDARKHLRFEFTFHTTRQNPGTFLYNTGVVSSLADPDLNVRQTWTLTRVDVDAQTKTVLGSGQVAPAYVGPISMPGYAALATAAVTTLPGGYKVFAGPRDDPFYVDLAAIFDLLSIRKPPGNRGKGIDGLSGYDVMSIVLQVPKSLVTKDGQAPDAGRNNHIIGLWNTAERAQTRVINGDGTFTMTGPGVQISRLGMPLVNEVVIPVGKKDFFNSTEPATDVANFGAEVVNPELAGLLHAIYGIAVPPAPRNDIVAVFATGVAGLNQPAGVLPGEMMRLNLAIAPAPRPNRMGVLAGDIAGFPNGRRLGDDVVDISLRVVAGVLVDGFNVAPNNQLGDGVDSNDKPFLPYFPYVALPHDPRENVLHRKTEDSRLFDLEEWTSDNNPTELPAISALFGKGSRPSALTVKSQGPGSAVVLEYAVERNARVSVKVYDVAGREVRTLVDQDAAAGGFRSSWDGRDDQGTQLRGVFFARMTSDGRALETRKVVLE